MAKGFDQHQERKNIVSGFGKDLVRRAKSKCELCEAQGVKLHVFELPPVKEPDYDRCLLLCDKCIEILGNLKKVNENDVRFLTGAIWSETPIVQGTALQMVRVLSERFPWCADLLEEVYIDESIIELSKGIDFKI